MASSLLAPAKVDYPSSDGQPMAESDYQRTPLSYAVDRLRRHFRHRDDVYVSGNLFIYYEAGNSEAAVAPDVFVVLGTSNADRRQLPSVGGAQGPDFVLEITSRRTYREDQVKKRELYRSLGVQEYWQYDPTRDYLGAAAAGPGADRRGVSAAAGAGVGGRYAGAGERGAGTGVAAGGSRAALSRSGDRSGPAEPCRNRRGAAAGETGSAGAACSETALRGRRRRRGLRKGCRPACGGSAGGGTPGVR